MTRIGGGGPRFHPGLNQTKKSEKTSKGGKAGKAKSAGAASETSAVSSTAPQAPVDELDSPIYDELYSAGKKLDEEDLEEATKAVVTAVIREHFGNKGLSDKEMQEITNAVSNSVNGDDKLRGRLESVLRRITVTKDRVHKNK